MAILFTVDIMIYALVISHYLFIIIPPYANKVDCAIVWVKSKEKE